MLFGKKQVNKMKKTIKQVGSSLGIIFNKEECKIYQLEKDDIMEIEIAHTTPTKMGAGEQNGMQ